ncbi:MAG: hypothetical protein CMG22_01660 [Candidatus Marinimicrobia bacterium]|nr:hypothetical protein [Candidatus Neomarinimicrobiota bacterium]
MSSIKKTSSIIIIAIIVAGIALGAIDQINSDDSDILEQIEFNAVYLENDSVVQISFHDKSNETESVVLEILGMDVTYHKEYEFDNDSEFVENMYLKEIPKYGWKTTPVILEIQHSKFGTIGLKTEVYELGDLKPKIIVEQ